MGMYNPGRKWVLYYNTITRLTVTPSPLLKLIGDRYVQPCEEVGMN
jgi:hypothetical protein